MRSSKLITLRSTQWLRYSRLLLLFLLLLTACAKSPTTTPTQPHASPDTHADTGPPPATIPSFDGVQLRVLTQADAGIGETLKQRGQAFETLSGAQVTIATLAADDLAPRTLGTGGDNGLSAVLNTANAYDVAILPPQLMLEAMKTNALEDISQRVQADTLLKWDDIAPFLRTYSGMYNQRIYAIPLDGDVFMVYYRSDVLERAGLAPPQTWEDYIAIARRFHGEDLNGDKQADYGSCLSRHEGVHEVFWSVASSFLQNQGTQQGIFFDPQTMQPLVQNEGFAAALNTLKAMIAYGPPDTLQLDQQRIRSLFMAGRCVLTIGANDMAHLMQRPDAATVLPQIGTVMLPGTSHVLDRSTGSLTTCNATTCPHAQQGINHAPYTAAGSWVGGINAATSSSAKDAGYAFLSFLSQPARANLIVAAETGGFNPYRLSQFTSTATLVQSGMQEEFATRYLATLAASLRHPNVALNLRIPYYHRYQNVVLDKALAEFLSGIMTSKQTMQRITAGWERITEEAGREQQRAIYTTSLGMQE